MQRTCDHCGRPYTAKHPSSRFCGAVCRKRAHRRGEVRPVASLGAIDANGAESELVAAVRRELDTAGRLETVLGQQALILAGKIGSAHETGSAVASLSKEFRTVMDAALDRADLEVNPLDELRARRERKLGRFPG